MKNIKSTSIILLISVFIAVIVSLISNRQGHEFSVAENILCGLGFFIALETINNASVVSDIHSLKHKESELWKVNSEADKVISNIRHDFHAIVHDSYGNKDLFVSHFNRVIHKLSRELKEVAEKKELSISANHFLNAENVLDAFFDDQNKSWSYTWPIEGGGEQLFDVLHWKQYFEETAKMVANGGIKQIKTILIVKDIVLLQDARIKKLLHFFKTTDKICCRIVTYKKYNDICSSDNFDPNQRDWGLYSKRFLYKNEQYVPEIRGLFTKESSEIDRYNKLFNAMWDLSAVSIENPSTETTALTLSELFAFDESDIA
jgi:hypothetical protein